MHLPDGLRATGRSGVSEAVALRAAEWFLLLKSGEASAQDHQRLQQWRDADAAHEVAWLRAQRLDMQLGGMPLSLSLPTLGRGARTDRRAMLKTVAALLAAPTAAWLAWRASPHQEWLADHRTRTGETRLVRLEDGSQVWLDTASAIDVAFGQAERRILLRAGQILVQTAADAVPDGAPGHRPFLVESAQGVLRALGTRFEVRGTDSDRSHVAVIEGAVEIMPWRMTGQRLVLQAGQQANFSSTDVSLPAPLAAQAGAWSQGLLRVKDVPLGDFLTELGRYRPGILRCAPEVAALRISGAFQVRDTDAVLNSLPRALPVTVTYRTRYWVTVAGSAS